VTRQSVLVALALAGLVLSPGAARSQQDAADLEPLLACISAALTSSGPAAYQALVVPSPSASAEKLAAEAYVPGATRVTIRERDRTPLGAGYRLMIELLTERQDQARISTWRLDVRPAPAGAPPPAWRIARQERRPVPGRA